MNHNNKKKTGDSTTSPRTSNTALVQPGKERPWSGSNVCSERRPGSWKGPRRDNDPTTKDEFLLRDGMISTGKHWANQNKDSAEKPVLTKYHQSSLRLRTSDRSDDVIYLGTRPVRPDTSSPERPHIGKVLDGWKPNQAIQVKRRRIDSSSPDAEDGGRHKRNRLVEKFPKDYQSVERATGSQLQDERWLTLSQVQKLSYSTSPSSPKTSPYFEDLGGS
ncbi:hypothetical protein GGS24DRAFT_461710 [Hypoxylon argillaceum]|nr:hypothetical protein GGS24DRAFT_461710 [Hypoxylon argillaceum]